MQKLKKYLCIAVATLMLCSCSSNDTAGTDSKVQNPVIQQTEEQHVPVQIKTSDDKHIAYIKDYVGKNCASFGYYSLGGDRMDRFGNGYIELIFVTADGTYVDIENDDDLKQYVVVAQNYEPNTEVRFTFDVDSQGNEYDSLVEWQSVKQIVMQVKKVGETSSFATSLTKLSVPEDKYTAYMPDYVGRNLRSCGYVALSGEYRTYVGKGNIKIVIVTSDGSYVDLDDEEAMRNYVVTGQSVAPNSEIKAVYEKNSSGEEYSDWIDYMTYEEIDLYVSPIG